VEREHAGWCSAADSGADQVVDPGGKKHRRDGNPSRR
jgi:hypothetical protein